MKIVDFHSIFDTNKETFFRCLNKASIVICDGTHLLVADDTYIYYFGRNSNKPKKFKSFYDFCLPLMKGKLLYSKNLHNYSSRCELVDSTLTGHGVLYRWLGEKNEN